MAGTAPLPYTLFGLIHKAALNLIHSWSQDLKLLSKNVSNPKESPKTSIYMFAQAIDCLILLMCKTFLLESEPAWKKFYLCYFIFSLVRK